MGLITSDFFGGDEAEQMRAVSGGADYVFQREDGKRRFMNGCGSL
jgi:type I restriction enzyme R subunit